MPRVMVWECPVTKKLFKTKRNYIPHLRRLADERWAKRTKERAKKNLEQAIPVLRQSGSLEQIAEWILTHKDDLWLAYCEEYWYWAKEGFRMTECCFADCYENFNGTASVANLRITMTGAEPTRFLLNTGLSATRSRHDMVCLTIPHKLFPNLALMHKLARPYQK